MAIVDYDLALLLTRSKREDNSRIKYEPRFSTWKVFIGPDDWDSEGKGVPKYRFESLPGSSSPGLYEIGIYPAGSSKVDPDKVVPVYVGKADNVRRRLQQYGSTGAHLGRSCHGEKGCGCLQDIFSEGYSIVYRRLPTKSNAEAQRKEAQLLKTNDYGWNKASNGARRHDEIMEKLHKRDHTTLAVLSGKRLPALQKQVGIKINVTKLLSHYNEFSKYADGGYNFFCQVFKVNRSQPRLLLDHGGFNENDNISCGVPLGDGSICRRPPVEGRKRCVEHKGKKTKGSSMRLNTSEKSQPHKPCSEYDSLCKSQPVSGRKKCDLHEGERICGSNSETRNCTVPYLVSDSNDNETSSFDKGSSGSFLRGKVETGVATQRPVSIKDCDTICGVELGDGYFCTKQPVRGRIRCEDHKGMRITSSLPGSDAKSKSHVLDKDSKSNSCNQNYGSSSSSKSICGATTCDGSFCRRTVNGNGRCWQHLNSGNSTARYLNYGSSSSSSICGAPTRDGSSCQRTVNGNGRCWQHSNYGSCSSSSSIYSPLYSNYGCYSASICGAPTRNGSYCRRTVRGNGRCWQH